MFIIRLISKKFDPSKTMKQLERFLNAQNGKTNDGPDYITAFNELKSGKKSSHWIWYIFPQLQSLGHSQLARKYGITNLTEACDYLQAPELANNYTKIIQLIESQLKKKIPLHVLMGNSKIDANKLVSSLTLFQYAAKQLADLNNQHQKQYNEIYDCCERIFGMIQQDNYYPCQSTLLEVKQYDLKLIPTKKSMGELNISQDQCMDKTELHWINLQENWVNTTAHLKTDLNHYISERKNEWRFHYNFLGIISVIYFLYDAVCGTDYLNSKSKEIKITAAQKLEQLIDPDSKETVVLSHSEKSALKEGRLGELIQKYGGLHQLLHQAEEFQNSNNHHIHLR